MHPLPPSLLPLRSFTKCSAPTRSQSPSRHVLMPLLVKIRPARSLACLPRAPARFGYSLESARARELAQCGHKLQWAGIGTSSVTAGMGTRPVSACAPSSGLGIHSVHGMGGTCPESCPKPLSQRVQLTVLTHTYLCLLSAQSYTAVVPIVEWKQMDLRVHPVPSLPSEISYMRKTEVLLSIVSPIVAVTGPFFIPSYDPLILLCPSIQGILACACVYVCVCQQGPSSEPDGEHLNLNTF